MKRAEAYLDECSGDGNALLLPATQLDASLAHLQTGHPQPVTSQTVDTASAWIQWSSAVGTAWLQDSLHN